MSKAAPKHKRIGKHDFRLVGRQELYFKGEHTVSFKPLPKKYINPHLANKTKKGASSLSSTTTANSTPTPSNCPLVPLTTTSNSSKNTKKEPHNLWPNSASW